uniref:Cadherin domain-containing protein n=1 Tax=Strigamia maritima TaxID=126957 RepID=T1J875_STRMM
MAAMEPPLVGYSGRVGGCLRGWILLIGILSSTVRGSSAVIKDGNGVRRMAVPHDAYPGFAIHKLASSLTDNVIHSVGFRMLDTDQSSLFAVLEDGLLTTTGNVSHLMGKPVTLVVLEVYPEFTATQTVQLHVLDSRKMLHFPLTVLKGEIEEHAPVGMPVRGLEAISAGEGVRLPVTYSIVSGNIGHAFRLEPIASNASVSAYGAPLAAVRLVVNADLDREIRDSYDLVVRATDSAQVDMADARVHVQILDLNDNAPIFEKEDYYIRVMRDTPRFSVVAQVHAYDADGDDIIYKATRPSPTFFTVPKTGEILLIGEPQLKDYEVIVRAHDARQPPLYGTRPAHVHIEVVGGLLTFSARELTLPGDEHLLTLDGLPDVHVLVKRHVKRSTVRPTKTVEYRESEGHQEGAVVFHLENKSGKEKFKLKEENNWVMVDAAGAVRVKRKWDYEELGSEKTIDFWVTITNTIHGGKYI